MKSRNEVKDVMIVYVRESIEFEDEYENTQHTKPFQKARIDESLSDMNEGLGRCTAIVIDNGFAEGTDFYFYHRESSPSDLLTSSEYQELKKKKFEVLENGSKLCPKCGGEVLLKWTHAFEKEWCPSCGYGLVK